MLILTYLSSAGTENLSIGMHKRFISDEIDKSIDIGLAVRSVNLGFFYRISVYLSLLFILF